MNVIKTVFPEVFIFEPKVYRDDRGFFFESYNDRFFTQLTGIECNFVQDNHSGSVRHVLRGLHYQIEQPQGKLVRATAGEIFDVIVDLRKRSKTFARWAGFRISETNKRQLWVPVGFAHGFLVLSGRAEMLYKTTDFYAPDHERCVLWDDQELAIDWPLQYGEKPILSAKDQAGQAFRDAEYF